MNLLLPKRQPMPNPNNGQSNRQRQGLRRWISLGLIGALACSLVVSQPQLASALSWIDLLRGGVQVVQSVQLSKMSQSQEIAIGKQINDELTTKEFKLATDRPTLDYVNRIGQRVALKSQRNTLPFIFQVVNDSKVNAFATMGGYVYITTGLLSTAENEAEVAGVLGHEVGHIEGKHLITQMSRTALQQGVMSAAGLDRSQAVQIGVQLASRLPNSRENEFDADRRGLTMMSAAGYAPTGMVSFMEKLMKLSSGGPTFMSTHPNTGDRVKELRKRVDPTKTAGDGLDTNAYKLQLRGQAVPTPIK
jgi:beta-barrel assembly-enhancing protease